MRRLLIRPGAIGDVICSLPALEFIAGDDTEIWAASAVLPLIRFARTASLAASGIDLVGIPGRDWRRTIDRLRTFDSIVSWYGARRPEFREAVAGLPVTFHDALPHSGKSAVEFYLHQVGATSFRAPNLPVDRRDEEFVVIHPFSGSDSKNWPIENFRAVAAELRGPVRWCAGPGEALNGAVRIDGLWDLAQWLAKARLYIGNDSGITHLAAACGVPVIAIFQASDPAVWAPPGACVLENPTVAELLVEAHRRQNRA